MRHGINLYLIQVKAVHTLISGSTSPTVNEFADSIPCCEKLKFVKGYTSTGCSIPWDELIAERYKVSHCLCRKIMDCLSSNNLLSDEQQGFRSGRSCATQLLNVLQEWTEYIESNEIWDTVYLDLSNAFDKVSHKRLINKISSFGIGGYVISWLKDFLTDRKQGVSIYSNSSSWKCVDSGVPQGSALGTVMFILYVNDTPEQMKSLVKIFADNTGCKLY